MATTRLIKSIVFRVLYLSVRSSRSSASRYAGVAILDEYQISLGDRGALSSAEASLCCGKAGEKEKGSARSTMGRGKREERLLPFLSSHLPLRPFYFSDYCYFYRDTQREPLRRKEGRKGRGEGGPPL